MTRHGRAIPALVADDASLRLRAAWMYYERKMTQKDVATALGVARTTVIRLLEEAVKRHEVQIWINEGAGNGMALASELERRFGLEQAVVVPQADTVDQAASSVGMALGQFLSQAIKDDMMVGVGWGRTLNASLASFRSSRRSGVKIVSLLGGMIEVRQNNPTDFPWQLASRLGADCFLYPSPLLVDSLETRGILRDRCGLDRLDHMAAALDIAVVSVGEVGRASTSLSRALIDDRDYREIVTRGGVCDLMCNVLDAEGRTLDHPINDRVMSVDLSLLAKASRVVIASGGAIRAQAIMAAIRRIGCTVLITDEGAARAILSQPEPVGSETA